ncbi:hypothetical protein J4573_05240 [Actinomadura barringtoniae]|uniref:Pyridoxamine 5'-phosphate oxidase family protein n=1 Tax=Actinomadura barringtoniae TaxID=1427535 RepID=A0A939T2F1_9ACTN|nr:hypothetical protein [Actinomadura barringtoniae]MBO2446483.1 hypothetical protein [Actinomadura barringtoniae]
MTVLPSWPARTVAVLAVVHLDAPMLIPVSEPVRADGRTILLSVHGAQASALRGLDGPPEVAVLILAEGSLAFTARGTARVVAQPMAGAPDQAVVEVAVTGIEPWEPVIEHGSLALRQLAVTRMRCRIAAHGDF